MRRLLGENQIRALLLIQLSAGICLAGNSDASLTEQGKALFKSHACVNCHGDAAKGTVAAPALAGIAKKLSPEELAGLLRHRTKEMKHGGMPPVSVSDQEMTALVAYLRSL